MPSLSKRVAYHEAGHAVASLVLGGGVELVTVVPDYYYGEFSLGLCMPQPAYRLRQLGRVRGVSDVLDVRTAIVELAGPIAEKKFCGECEWIEAMKFLDCRGFDVSNLFDVYTRACEVVDENWEAIERVAWGLGVQKWLGEDEVVRLVEAK